MRTTAPVIFWDFDGTLARRDEMWSGALVDAMACVDPSARITVEQIRPHLGTGFPWHEPTVVRDGESAEAWWAAMHPVFDAAYTANGVDVDLARQASLLVASEFYRPDAWALVDGTSVALATTAKAGRRNIVLSNHAPELPALVDALGLGDLVEETITSARVGAEKPNPVIFAFAFERAGVVDARDARMVGDNPIADVHGARRFGMRAILADGGRVDPAGVTVSDAAALIVASSR